MTRDKLLNVRGLNVAFGDHGVVRDVDLAVGRGEVVGLVGESGSGKSLTALAIIRLLPDNASQTGAISLNGQALDKLDEKAMCRLRGRAVGMVFQEPMTALNPLQTIGHQVAESIALHRGVSRREALADARETLDRVGLSQAAAPLGRYPHELSGGQRQRVVIAIAIAAGPSLLIADEPTTALDVSTQAGILTLLKRLTLEEGMGLLLISHDLAVVAAMADRICVMKEGAIVDRGAGRTFIAGTTHPYTRRLVAAASHVPLRSPRLATGIQLPPLLKVDGATRDYRLPRRSLLAKRETLRAVDGVSFSIDRGENLGLVGESGCGKSTLARAIMGLEPLQAGSIHLDRKLFAAPGRLPERSARRHLQVVFQDPYGSFNPRHRVARLVAEPFHLLGAEAPAGAARLRAVDKALETVGLAAADGARYIHEFSGGQRQRIALARALLLDPALVILDEAVSALDVSIRAQILDLLADLSDRLNLSYLFISHDLSVVRAITDRVLVMRDGRIVEEGETATVFAAPRHDYTRALVAATPTLDGLRQAQPPTI